jgi:hypothetical protein
VIIVNLGHAGLGKTIGIMIIIIITISIMVVGLDTSVGPDSPAGLEGIVGLGKLVGLDKVAVHVSLFHTYLLLESLRAFSFCVFHTALISNYLPRPLFISFSPFFAFRFRFRGSLVE